MISHFLILDTTIRGALVALAETATGRVVALKADTAVHAATGAVGRLCSEILRENDLTWEELAAFGVAQGPGSFTGIKVGLAFALGVRAAQPKLAVHPLSSLQSLAEHGEDNTAWLLPSNRLQGFLGVRAGRVTDLFIVDVAGAPRLLAEKDRLEVSSEILKDRQIRLLFPWPEAEKAFAAQGFQVKVEDESDWTRSVALAQAKALSARLGARQDPAPLEPRYIRDSAPQEKLRTEGRKG